MLSKCANPSCSHPFLYLRRGSLFRVEIPATAPTAVPAEFKQSSHRVEFFWLCEECAAGHVVTLRNGQGVQVIPRSADSTHGWLVS